MNNANQINHDVLDKFFISGGEELHDLDYEIHDEGPNCHLVAFIMTRGIMEINFVK